jgi:hypothetical protein
MSLEKLIALAYKKNTINLRRRRFLTLKYQYIGSTYYKVHTKPHKTFTKKFILSSIKKTSNDMKKLTKSMRLLCKKNNARLVWDDNWMIYRIKTNACYWTRADFEKIAFDYEAECHLLGLK